MTDLPDTDFTQRFIFDERDVRGELVSLERSYAEVLAKHPYPQPVAQLLGELMAAAALLVGALKFDGLLSLQLRGREGGERGGQALRSAGLRRRGAIWRR